MLRNKSDSEIRDFILARVLAALVRVDNATEALKAITQMIIEPEGKEKDEEILELLEIIADDTGGAARSVEAIQAVFEEAPSLSLFDGEPDFGDDDEKAEEDDD
ncbi:MAG: hypothetical protein Q8S00_32485 [Deltaproteobacteria bacterium]|nr:hypothetical protein [Deltaproteobacteria bacterium]